MGAIPGILRAYLGTSEVIVTIMMNYIVLYVEMPLFMPSLKTSCKVQIQRFVLVLMQHTRHHGYAELTRNSRMNIGFFFAIIAVAVIWFLLKKTTLGFEIPCSWS